MDNISITRPQKEDFREIYDLFFVTINKAFEQNDIKAFGSNEFKDLVDKMAGRVTEDFETNSEKYYFLVARSNGKIVGTVASGEVSQIVKENVKNLADNAVGVTTVYVLPEFQGKGVGSLLFKEILKHLTEDKIENFYLDTGYKIAKKFWTKRLGKPFMVLKDYWGPEQDQMIWFCGTREILDNTENK